VSTHIEPDMVSYLMLTKLGYHNSINSLNICARNLNIFYRKCIFIETKLFTSNARNIIMYHRKGMFVKRVVSVGVPLKSSFGP